MATIPSLLRTVAQQQDEEELNVDLSFATRNTQDIPYIPSRHNTGKGADEFEKFRDEQFRENSTNTVDPETFEKNYIPQPQPEDEYRAHNPVIYQHELEKERWQNSYREEQQKDRNFELKQKKVAAMNQSAITFDYYAPAPEHSVTSRRNFSEINFADRPSIDVLRREETFTKSFRNRPQDSIADAIKGMAEEAPRYIPQKKRTEYSVRSREYDLAAPWRKNDMEQYWPEYK